MTPRLLALPVLALALAACGGGGDDEAKQAYVEDATRVCETGAAEFAKLKTPTAPAEFGPFVQQTIAIAEKAQTDLAALTPPEQDRAELQSKVLDPFAELVEDGKAFGAKVDAAGADQAKLLPLLSERPSAEGIDLEYLRSYGLDACADTIDAAG